jgi:hypothetical protein
VRTLDEIADARLRFVGLNLVMLLDHVAASVLTA